MIDTATFVAGVGVLVALDLSVLGISVVNARRVASTSTTVESAEDDAEAALETAERAERVADEAHNRIRRHHGRRGD